MLVINACTKIPNITTDGTVKSYNHGDRIVNFLCEFFVRLDISGRVLFDENIVYVPTDKGMPIVDEFLL